MLFYALSSGCCPGLSWWQGSVQISSRQLVKRLGLDAPLLAGTDVVPACKASRRKCSVVGSEVGVCTRLPLLFAVAFQTPGWQQTSRDQPAAVEYDRLQPAQPRLRTEQLQLPSGACQLPDAASHCSSLLSSYQVILSESEAPCG